MDKVNVPEKMKLFSEYWSPRILGEVNESYIKAAKFKGEFLWHTHEHEDEMFYVIKGELTVHFRDRDITVKENEFLVVPRGTEHMPYAPEEVEVMIIEAKSTLNTGDVKNERTVENLQKI